MMIDAIWLKLGGYQIYTEQAGSGPPLLLLHGFAGSTEDWAVLWPYLAQLKRRIIAVDGLGFGRSAKPADAPYSLELQCALYAELIARSGGRAAILAHSMGSKYALALAVWRPELVERLLLLAPDGFTTPPPLSQVGALPGFAEALLAVAGRPTLVRRLLRAAFADPDRFVDAAALARGLAAISGPENRRALAALSRRYAANALQPTGVRQRLGELRCPTVMVWGRQDQVFPIHYAHTAQREIANAQLLLLDRCGHFPQIEAPRAVGGFANGFL